jgi:hypothetical protein
MVLQGKGRRRELRLGDSGPSEFQLKVHRGSVLAGNEEGDLEPGACCGAQCIDSIGDIGDIFVQCVTYRVREGEVIFLYRGRSREFRVPPSA